MAVGDLIQVQCTRGPIRYLHYGIDIGDGTVVHLAMDRNGRSMSVQRVSVDDFCNGSEICVEAVEKPLPPEVVVEKALATVGKQGYHLAIGNCEHFARLMKTGKGESHQVDVFVGTVVRTAFSCLASTAKRNVIASSLTALSQSRFLIVAGSLLPTVVSETARHGTYLAARKLKMTHEQSSRSSRSVGYAASALSGFVLGGPVGSAGSLAISIASDRVTDAIKSQIENQN